MRGQKTIADRKHPLRRRWRKLRRRYADHYLGRFFVNTAIWLMLIYIRLCVFTSLWHVDTCEQARRLIRGNQPFIFVVWHCHGILAMALFRYLGARQPCALIMSRHRDGRVMSRFQQSFGVETIYGSTKSSGAITVLRRGVEILHHKNRALGFTPDGPLGPSLTIQPGLAWMAAQANVPVVGYAWMGRRTGILQSWDSYRFPRLFDRCAIKTVGPFYIEDKSRKSRECFEKEFTYALREALYSVDRVCERPSPQAGSIGKKE